MTFKWYIVHTMSGSENRVKQVILDQAAKNGMADYFQDIVIPAVEVKEIKKGKEVTFEKKLMTGYILVNMNLTDDSWHLVRKTPKVSGFLGSASKPQPVPESQVKTILQQIEDAASNLVSSASYQVGQSVKVIDGPFESFTGTVEDVDSEKSQLRVSVSIFGRETPLDLKFSQVQTV